MRDGIARTTLPNAYARWAAYCYASAYVIALQVPADRWWFIVFHAVTEFTDDRVYVGVGFHGHVVGSADTT